MICKFIFEYLKNIYKSLFYSKVRLTNGSCLTHKFSPNEQLAAVRLFVQMNRTDSDGPFGLMTNFPKKVFTEDDMNTPLNVLGKYGHFI